MYKLIIGNKNYSSWSLRAWLYMRESGLAFEEIRLSMFSAGWKKELARYTPAGRVPVLIHGSRSIWDSLAIMEYLNETETNAVGWPQDPEARALARSIVCEMHAGFMAVRDELPQNIRQKLPLSLDQCSDAARQQVARIVALWEDCRNRFGDGGPWLFGTFTIADAFYAPVALRFATYGLSLGQTADSYLHALWALESIQEWRTAATAEPEHFEFIDNLSPVNETPLTQG